MRVTSTIPCYCEETKMVCKRQGKTVLCAGEFAKLVGLFGVHWTGYGRRKCT